jgi:hypothetical protein
MPLPLQVNAIDCVGSIKDFEEHLDMEYVCVRPVITQAICSRLPTLGQEKWDLW